MKRFIIIPALVLGLGACSSDEQAPQEGVAADGQSTEATVYGGAAAGAAGAVAGSTGAVVPGVTTSAPAAAAPSVGGMGAAMATAAASAAVMPQGTPATVSVSHLNVRSGPGMRFPVVRVVSQNTRVNQLAREGRWVKIGNNEYVSARYLTPSN